MSFSLLATSLGLLLGQSVIAGYCSGGELMPAILSSLKSTLSGNDSFMLPSDQLAILCSISKKEFSFYPLALLELWACNLHSLCFLKLNIYSHLSFYWASLVAQMVKNLPAMQETWVRSLGWVDPLEGMATHSSILAWRIPMDRGAWWTIVHRVTKNRTQLSDGLCIISLPNWTPYPCFL